MRKTKWLNKHIFEGNYLKKQKQPLLFVKAVITSAIQCTVLFLDIWLVML